MLVPAMFGQLSGLNGVVTDATGSVVPAAEVDIMNEANGFQRSVVSNEVGRYTFVQLPPGSYTLSAFREGFAPVIIEGISLLVNTSVTLPVALRAVEAVQETVTVSAAATQLNTTDASVGNAFGTKPIQQLPLNARNPAGLLSLQAGVTFLSADPLDARKAGDIRNGTVNGARSDQSNVTLDGVDVNDQNGRLPFTSVLRNTLDSIQEFRVV
ncbi:MAG: carboxypeptidase-like regulatory domain-containing protein, partial [Bryobacterales bacterium]|nr:carboxypeptidase-like regulatory domain-containing protein [Bryobacterales bacterium]